MKKLIISLLSYIIIFTSVAAETISSEDLSEIIIDYSDIEEIIYENESSFLGIDYNFLVSDFEVLINEEYVNLRLNADFESLIAFDYFINLNYKLNETSLELDHIKVGIFKIPSFIQDFVLDKFKFITSDLSSIDLYELLDIASYIDLDITLNEGFITTTDEDEDLEEDSKPSDEEIVVIQNHIYLDERDINDFLNNSYILDKLNELHYITYIDYDDFETLTLEIDKDDFNYDVEIDCDLSLNANEDLTLEYKEVRVEGDELSTTEIQELASELNLKYNAFRDQLYIDGEIITSAIEMYVDNIDVSLDDIYFEDDQYIIKLRGKVDA